MSNEIYNFETWINIVEPFTGESISHFLGRFERANLLTGNQIGKEAGIGAVVTRWRRLFSQPISKRTRIRSVS